MFSLQNPTVEYHRKEFEVRASYIAFESLARESRHALLEFNAYNIDEILARHDIMCSCGLRFLSIIIQKNL